MLADFKNIMQTFKIYEFNQQKRVSRLYIGN